VTPKDTPEAVAVDLTRREAIKLATVATLAASIGCSEPPAPAPPAAAAPPPQTFFTSDELTLADELSELIIPADGHSPGARAAKVAAYIDARLAEAWDPSEKTTWREGLGLVNQVSQQLHGRPFMNATTDQRAAVLTQMAANESKPEKPEEKFFVELKTRVVEAYYSSEIGIKQEMEYKGNTYLQEFVGTDVSQA